jgi:hypothetical protein
MLSDHDVWELKNKIKYKLDEWKRKIKGTVEAIIGLFTILYILQNFINPILTSSEIAIELFGIGDIYQLFVLVYIFICGFLYYMIKDYIISVYISDND